MNQRRSNAKRKEVQSRCTSFWICQVIRPQLTELDPFLLRNHVRLVIERLLFHYTSGGGYFVPVMKRAMVKKDYKEVDEAIKTKVPPFLYNGGDGKMVPIAQLTMLRNRDRSTRKQV